MEKRKPHFKLELVKQAVTEQRYRFTRVALEGGAELGMEMADMLAVISALSSRDFFKSMTTYADHTIWQDVYRPDTEFGLVYLKFTLVADLLIVSFKEK
ncbi:type II toxin-antitoxin system MqsR family toxin [Pseudomonas sp. zfem001]|uniref:type II toxin-antitoxin system MqsR family toxin n=1 Tax=Pseudomonas sp. zfem001 TaxID=3078196 RepID=UPI0029296D2A|nr:type II toxin-antitoxin system MqsR family toxin [Pseudomonas sp. zfem001]MDU9408070.1 type II toxin-antitoxin system MqsR family toxin [Pseudomonas sp. zfem001]